MRVLNDQIAVKRVETTTMSEGGIVIPEMAQRATARGLVVSVGPGRALVDGARHPLWVHPGDVVVFIPNVGYEATIDGVELLFLREDHILAVLDPPAPPPLFADELPPSIAELADNDVTSD